MKTIIVAARLGCLLGRDRELSGHTADQIAADVAALLVAAEKMRAALTRQKPYGGFVAAMGKIAERYGVEVVANADPCGMVVGLRLRGGSAASAPRNVVPLA